MEAAGSKVVSDVSLNSGRTKLTKLESRWVGLVILNLASAGVLLTSIPRDRIRLMPKRVVWVACAEKK